MSDSKVDIKPKNGNGVWKWVSSMMGTAMITGLGAWLAFGGGVTASVAKEISESHVQPIREEQKQMREWLKNLSKSLSQNREEMIDRLGRIETEQKAQTEDIREIKSLLKGN